MEAHVTRPFLFFRQETSVAFLRSRLPQDIPTVIEFYYLLGTFILTKERLLKNMLIIANERPCMAY